MAIDFTIYDFVKAYEHFNDPDWDGEPAEPEPTVERPPGETSERRGDGTGDESADDEEPQRRLIKVKLADGKERTIQHLMATTFWSPDGTPMSAAQFVERLFGELPELFKDEDELRALWGRPDTRNALLEGLAPGPANFGRDGNGHQCLYKTDANYGLGRSLATLGLRRAGFYPRDHHFIPILWRPIPQ